ncbi:MAG: hypothetical protein PVI66_09245 [Candidatus Aminicenantes bacterium]|jgi:hypothetical protein
MRLGSGLGILQLLIGLGAVAGGVGLISGGLKFPLEWLSRSPFTSYLIPGIVLLTVNGIGSLVGGFASFRRYRYAGDIAVALGIFLALWIVIQVYWVGGVHWLHILYFVLGVLEFLLGLLLRQNLKNLN